MAGPCLKVLNTGLQIPTINAVAYNAYSNHTSGNSFTDVEQIEIYKDLVKAVEDGFYGGDVKTLLLNIISDPNAATKEEYKKHILAFQDAFDMINDGFKIIQKKVGLKPKDTAGTYRFRLDPSAVIQQVFTEYVGTKTIVSNPPLPSKTETTIEAVDEPPVKKDIETRSVLLNRLMKEHKAHLDPILQHLHNIVSKSWVDGEVRADGTVRGFTPPKEIVNTIKERLQAKIYDYLASRSVGTFSIMQSGKETKYIVFNPELYPTGVVNLNPVVNSNVLVGEQKDFATVRTNNGDHPVKIVLATTLEEATIALTPVDTKSKLLLVIPNANTKGNRFAEASFTNADAIDPEDLPVFYSHILSNPSNFSAFIKSEYPALDSSFKSKHRTGYEEPGTVNGPNQDTASIILHKQATPRLVVSESGRLEIDLESPYLTASDFNLVSGILSKAPTDLPGMGEYILRLSGQTGATSEESNYKKSILTSIYYRFFHPDDYDVADSKFSNKLNKMRSYTGIVAAQKMKKHASVKAYETKKAKGEKMESPNALLSSSLSALVTSFRTITANEQVGQHNNREEKTNITGHGVTVEAFNADFITRTTTGSAAGSYTDSKYLSGGRVVIKLDDSAISKLPRLRITIKESEQTSVTYLVEVNIPSDENSTGFTNGIPLSIIDRSTVTSQEQVAKLFAGFRLPDALTSPFHLKSVRTSLESFNIKNEKNIKTIFSEMSGGDIDITLDSLYINMLFTMVLNGQSRLTPVGSLFKAIPVPVGDEEAALTYNPIDIIYGYKAAIADIILHTEGELGSKYSQTYDGNKIAEYIQVSHLRRTAQLANNVTEESIHYGNVITPANQHYRLGPQNWGKKGVKLGDASKTVEKLTPNENLSYLLESCFLDECRKSTKFSTVIIQPGTQSDRLHPQLMQFIAVADDGIFLKDKGWDNELWAIHGETLMELNPKITPTMLSTVKSAAQLQMILNDRSYKVLYKDIKDKASNLFSYARILEDEDGFAFVPDLGSQDLYKLDINTLSRRALYVQQNYYSNLDRIGASEWVKALDMPVGTFTTLQQVADHLKDTPVPYSKIRAISELVESSMIVEDKNGNAAIPPAVLQAITVFSNDTLGLEYIETMRRMFMQQLTDADYKRIPPASAQKVADIMGVKNFSANANTSAMVAREILTTAYFYNSQILGISALNLHSGGIAQYDVRGNSVPLLDINRVFTKGKLDHYKVIKQAAALKVPGSTKDLGDISVNDILQLREQAKDPGELHSKGAELERLVFMKVILTNEASFSGMPAMSKALLFNDLTKSLNDKFVQQVKRNAVYGTAMQHPRIVGINEPGFLLAKASKNIAIKDDQPSISALGKSGPTKVVATDGVQMAHPLFEIRYNNSIGDKESSFRSEGCATKDLTVSNNKGGSTKTQKKATFGSLTNDLVSKGSVLADQLLDRMSSAIKFKSKNILVDRLGKSVWTNLDLNTWKLNGLNSGFLKYTAPDGTESIKDSSEILYEIRKGAAAMDAFETDILAGNYKTDKEVRSFDDVLQLWEYFGAQTNPDAWYIVADILGNYAGFNEDAEGNLTLADTGLRNASYANRDAYIEKAGYVSQEKTGGTNVITWENLLDPNYKFDYTDETGIARKVWSEVNNESYGTILQAEHNYDTTAPNTGLYSEDDAEMRENQVSLITQIITAVSAEGQSIVEANMINETIGELTKAQLEALRNRIVSIILRNHPTLPTTRMELIKILKKGYSKKSPGKFTKEIYDACEEYASELMVSSLAKKETDTGFTSDLLSRTHREALTFDQKQLLPLFQSQLFSDFDKKTVRMKFAGGQYVVSPSHALLPTYDLTLPTISKTDKPRVLFSGINRDEMNKYFYGTEFANLKDESLQRQAIEHSFPLKQITDINMVKRSDIVVHTNENGVTTETEFIHIKNKIARDYDALKLKATTDPLMTLPTLGAYLKQRILTGDYKFRFGNVSTAVEGAGRLQWAKWTRYDTAGNEYNVLDSTEFKAFNTIDPLASAFLKGTTYDTFFGLDITKPLLSTPAKINSRFQVKVPAVPGLDVDIKEKVPEGLIREYYFSAIDPKSKNLPSPTLLIMPVQEENYTKWKASQPVLKVLEATYNFIGKNAANNPEFKKRFKSHLYNLLQDDKMGWVSTPAQVYMPHMHASEFTLNDGKDGSRPDSLFDIIGLQELPSTNKLESMRILTHKQAVEFSFDYDSALETFKTDPNGDYHKLSPAAQQMFDDEYANPMVESRNNMTKFFRKRLRSKYPAEFVEGSDPSLIAAPINLFVFRETIAERVLNEAIRKRAAMLINKDRKAKTNNVGTTDWNALTEIITRLETAEYARKVLGVKTYESPEFIISDVRSELIKTKTAKLVKNFQKTLDFIMARIPAQGKQSFIHARMKNLVFSSKNSVYGPLELILLAGLDYDIDKQNMMTWSLNGEGDIVDWVPYLKNGKLSRDKLNAKITEDAAVVMQVYAEDAARLTQRLAEQDIKIAEVIAGTSDADLDTLRKYRTKLENYLAAIPEKTQIALDKAEEANRVLFTQAGQNFIVQNLIETISSSKNAIESSTPVSIADIQDATQLPEIKHLFNLKTKIGLEDLFISQGITSGVNPYSTIQYEKVNMDGKSGISIYASDLKAYLAAYYATRTADAGQQNHITLKSDLVGIPDKYKKMFGIENGNLQFFKSKIGRVYDPTRSYSIGETAKTGTFVYTAIAEVPVGISTSDDKYWALLPDVMNMKYIANIEKWSGDSDKLRKNVASAMTQLKDVIAANPNDVDGQYNILLKYANDVNLLSSMDVKYQAWEGLSQLLTASTDNAKELILGKIGANNTTNSLISTMIRMGVGLKDAIFLVNQKSIKDVVKEIEQGGDLQLNAEASRDLAVKGIVQDDTFNEKLADRLKKLIPKVNEFSTPSEVYTYLTNPARILHTYTNIAGEFSSLSKLLSINQGLKNSAYEVWNYISSINDSINKSITDYNKANPNDQIAVEFSLEEFIANVSNDRMVPVNKLFRAMDKIRTGVNVPYILYKNAHYFGYFEALFQAESIRNRLSFVNQFTGDIIEEAKTEYGKRNITDKIYKKVSDTIYEFGVLSFLDKEVGKKTPLQLDGLYYDLSKPKGDGTVLGRSELVQNLPGILAMIENNAFVDSLRHDRSKVDQMTGIDVKILKGLDLTRVDSMQYSRLSEGINSLKAARPDIYTALFYYGMITTKGGYGGGSFIGLFDITEYLRFSTFLKERSNQIQLDVINRKELIWLLNPILLPQFSTIAKIGKFDPMMEIGDDTFLYDVEPQEDDAYFDPLGNTQTYWKNLTKEKFVIDNLNEAKRKPDTLIKENFFRSKNNGMLYQWDDDLKMWVMLTRDVPEAAIPWTLPLKKQDYITLDKTAGYIQGHEINMPTVINTYSASGTVSSPYERGTVMCYISGTMKGFVKSPPDDISSSLLAVLNSTKKAIDPKEFVYIVKSNRGDYFVATKKELEDANQGYIFDESFISVASKTMDITESQASKEVRFYTKDSEYYRSEEDGREAVDITPKTQGRETTNPVRYDGESTAAKTTLDKLVTTVSKGSVSPRYNTVEIETEYQSILSQLSDNLLATEMDISIDKAADIRRRSASFGQKTQNIVKAINNRIERKFGFNPSLIGKIELIDKATHKVGTNPVGFIELFDSFQSNKQPFRGLSTLKLGAPSAELIPFALKEFLMTDAVDNITRLKLDEFKTLIKKVGLPSTVYDNYINGFYLGDADIDVLFTNADKVYLRTGSKISASKQLARITDRIEKGKPVYLPASMRYEYQEPANKAVLYALTRFLNNRLPGVKWNLMSTAEIKSKYGERFVSDFDDHVVKAFFKADGEVIINMDIATLETPLHEFGHVYLQYLMEEDLAEYQRIMELTKNHVLFETMKNTYPGISSVDLSEEVFCELLSMAATHKLISDRGGITEQITDTFGDTTGRFGRILNTFTRWIKSLFFSHKQEWDIQLSMNDSLGSVMSTLTDDILFGKSSMLSKFSETTKDQIRKSRTGAVLTIKEAREVLMSRGYIEWYCV